MGWESPLTRARAALGKSQDAVADKAGISRTTYRRAERSPVRKPFVTTRYRIAKAIRFFRAADGMPVQSVEEIVEELWP